MSDHQLSHIGVQSKLRSLCSSSMISFLGACLLGLCKGGLMEKQDWGGRLLKSNGGVQRFAQGKANLHF